MAVAPTLDNTIGAMFIGVLLSAILYGVSCLQTWNYYMGSSRDASDPKWLKITVAGVWASDTVHLGMCVAVVCHYAITNFANPPGLDVVYWPVVAQVLFNGFTAVLVQAFFVRRIYLLSNRSRLLVSPIIAVMVTQFVINIAYVVKTLPVTSFGDTSESLTGSLDATTILADVLISAVLSTILYRSRTEFAHTNSLINKLMLFTLNTGLITSLTAVAKLTCYYALPGTLIYIGIYWCLGRVYCNSFLAALNTRAVLKRSTNDKIHYSVEDWRSQASGGRTLNHSVDAFAPRRPAAQLSVQIETTRDISGESKDLLALTPVVYARPAKDRYMA